MARIFYILLLALVLPVFSYGIARSPLQKCWLIQGKTGEPRSIRLDFTETIHTLEHDFDPWKLTTRTAKGSVWINENYFSKSDTLTSRNRSYYSKTVLNDSILLFQDYGDDGLFEVNQGMVAKQMVQTARYSPMLIAQYFMRQYNQQDAQKIDEESVYELVIGESLVVMRVNHDIGQVLSITAYAYDELYGDVSTMFEYSNYSKVDGIPYPRTIKITSLGGKVVDTVQVKATFEKQELPELLAQPAGYQLKPDVLTIPQVRVEKYNDHIHFVELLHTDDRVLIVEFADFLLIAEAPLNSQNGELILAEVKKIAPTKPVKYFVFGHHHPHYLGGIRPFVHAGVQIICVPENQDYVQYLAAAQHTGRPDMQQKEPQPVRFDLITQEKTITNGSFEMKIYFIGNQSQHTNDYLIYYFPTEKLLFEDDLVWIARTGEPDKASDRQAGLYKAVTALGLDIETIVQSWPVADYGVKTVIPFVELEQSMGE
jgi:glyoxylase-like metal-dependent hydrolase (beta-lactamase superfamily II)